MGCQVSKIQREIHAEGFPGDLLHLLDLPGQFAGRAPARRQLTQGARFGYGAAALSGGWARVSSVVSWVSSGLGVSPTPMPHLPRGSTDISRLAGRPFP